MSAEKILKRIMDDAGADAEAALAKAREESKARVAGAKESARAEVLRIEQRAEADAAETERRRMLTASLDARKESLAARRSLMDRAFSGALERLISLPEPEYTALVAGIVAAASEAGNEKIIAPLRDEKRYSKGKMLQEMNRALKEAGKPGELTFGGTADFSGGALLSGEITDVDCSFESLLAQFREDREMEVANILFGSEV